MTCAAASRDASRPLAARLATRLFADSDLTRGCLRTSLCCCQLPLYLLIGPKEAENGRVVACVLRVMPRGQLSRPPYLFNLL